MLHTSRASQRYMWGLMFYEWVVRIKRITTIVVGGLLCHVIVMEIEVIRLDTNTSSSISMSNF